MRNVFCLLILILGLVLPVQEAVAEQIRSISPTSASAGTEVSLRGGPFTDGTLVLVGETVVTPKAITERSIRFLTPPLSAGEYRLALKTAKGVVSSSFVLRVVEPRPVITSISPPSLDTCREASTPAVTVSGRQFLTGARVLINGAAIATQTAGENRLTFSPPPLAGGLHEVTVANPGGTASVPAGLFIDSTPAIDSVRQGEDRVNAHEIVIEGKNFLYASTLAVDGKAITNLPRDLPRPPQVDHMRYLDCRTLIYVRYPYSRETRELSLQVINPSGEQSPVRFFSTP